MGLISLQKESEIESSKKTLRVEDLRLITGTGNYVDDHKIKGVAHAFIVRSPYAHAKIKQIDFSEALSLPGVVDVVTGRDALRYTKPYPQAFEIPVKDYCFAIDEVVYVGQPVAAIVAENRYIAEDAAYLVNVDYESMEHVLDARSGSDSGPVSHSSFQKNRVYHKKLTYGNVDGAFEKADLVLSESFLFESYSAMPLETFGVIADYNRATGTLVIHDNCQIPLYTIQGLSQALSIPSNKIRFIEQDIGGGFGVKTMVTMYDILVSLLSIKTGVPVKWIETRSEHMMASSHGTRRQYRVKTAVTTRGEITAIKVEAFEDVGAFVRRPGQTALVSCLRAFSGPYKFRAFEYDMNMVLTNKCPAGPSRGNGKNHHAFMLERMIDRVAEKLKLDPVQVRLRNLIQPENFPYQTANGCLYDSGDYPSALSHAVEMIGYREFRSKQANLRNEGRTVGIGFAITLDPAASNMAQDIFYHDDVDKWGTSESASIHMDQMGNVTIALSSVPQGQGHETTATQLVSEILGIKPENVTVFTGFDSSRNIGTPTSGTYSSRFAPICANAIILAAEELKKKLLRTASKALRAMPEELAFEGGKIMKSSNHSIQVNVQEIASLVYSGTSEWIPVGERSLDATVTYSYSFGRNKDEEKTNLASTYAYQVHAAVVEVDIETGKVKILDYAIVDDSGKSLNRMIVEGQVHGGACNGIAAALYEKFVYDEEGQLLTSTFNDYLAPTAVEVPLLNVSLLENRTPFTPSGAKGVGESGALGPQPAIMNAIEDALRAFNSKVQESHMTPEKILDTIHLKRSQNSISD